MKLRELTNRFRNSHLRRMIEIRNSRTLEGLRSRVQGDLQRSEEERKARTRRGRLRKLRDASSCAVCGLDIDK